MASGDSESPVRLNLGCGARLMDGFINVDLAGNWSNRIPDVVADVTTTLPFDDSYADEVHSYHVLEHIYRWLVPDVLKEWTRVLKPGGLLVLEMPCMDKILTYAFECHKASQPLHPQMFYHALYGDPGYRCEAMCHRWCYSSFEATELLQDSGLVDVKLKPPQTHIKHRDMRIEGSKP